MKSKTFTRITKVLLLAVLFLFVGVRGWGQTSITALSTPVTQNFDGLASSGAANAWSNNSTLQGWYAKTTGVSSFNNYGTDDGSLYTSGLYSFGNTSNSDRALGYSGDTYTGTYYLGWRLRNNTGTVIKSFTVTFEGEQWRNISTGQQNIKLSYKINETNLTATGFTNALANFFTAPYPNASSTVTALDGNNSANRASVTNSISFSVNIEPGDEVMLRWADLRVANKDVMAIDNVSVTAEGLPAMPVALAPSNVSSNRFTINWIPGIYATGYYIDIFDDQNNYLLDDYFVDGASTSSLALPEDAIPATTYYYEITSYNGGSGDYSATASNQITTYTESNEPDYIFYGQGGTSTLWNIPANWSSGIVPTNYNSAIIAANCYVNIPNAVCNNLNIDNGIMLSIGSGQMLTVNGEITEDNASALIRVESNGTGAANTGILMHGNNGVNGIIQRNVEGSGGGANIFQLVSVPINTSITPLYSEVFLYSYLARYDESANNWYQMNTPTDNSIYTGRGYLTSEPTTNEETYSFNGRLNNGTVNMTVSYAGAGWNLVGNPFPSTIDWNSSLGWTKTNIDNTVYVWDGTNNRYATYINGSATNGGSNLIAPGQAFFVRANSAGPALSVNNVARVSTQKAFLKDEIIPQDILRITAKINDLSDELVVLLENEASIEFDRNYDAYNLSSMAGLAVPDIYTIDANNTKYSINSLPFTSEEMIIDMVFKYGTNGIVTLKATELESFLTQHPDLGILLEDKQTGTITSLKLNPEYTFSYSTTDEPNRFRIHMGNTLGVHENITNAIKCQVFAVQNDIYIKYADFANQAGSASIFDLQGRMLKQFQLDQSGNQQEHINVTPGIYMVKLTFSGHSETHKIAVR